MVKSSIRILFIYLIFFSLCWNSAYLFSQDAWAVKFGGTKILNIESVLETNDGDYLILGCSDIGSFTENEIWLAKVDSAGALLWQKNYGGNSIVYAFDIKQTNDNNFIIAGAAETSSSKEDALIFIVDSSGNIIWQKLYGGSQSDYARSIEQTADGGFIIAGFTESFGNGDFDMWILKLDSTGIIEWQKTYGGTSRDEAWEIRQTADGGYIVAGVLTQTYPTGKDPWVLKLNSDGDIEWQKHYGGLTNEYAYSIINLADGNYAVSGRKLNGFWIAKLSTSGNIIWEKNYKDWLAGSAYSVKQTTDNGLIIVGSMSSKLTMSPDIWLLRLDSSGNEMWQISYGGGEYEEGIEVQQTSDGGFIVGGENLFLKLDLNGNIDNSCAYLFETSIPPTCVSSAEEDTTELALVTTATETSISLPVFDANRTINLQCPTETALFSFKPLLDDSGSSTPNGIIEIDEAVNLIGSIENKGISTGTCTGGMLTSTSTVYFNNAFTSYPDIAPGTSQNATIPYNIYVSLIDKPSAHWDIYLTEISSCLGCIDYYYDFRYHIGNSFPDVTPSNIFYSYIETIYHSNITSGCFANAYCPLENVSREQMAKFICKAINIASPCSCQLKEYSGIFADVPDTNIFSTNIEALYNAGIVSGCQASPLLYCPAMNTSRQEMAKFICLGMQASAPGSCVVSPCTGIFNDIPSNNPFCSYIEALYNTGKISGCQVSPPLYCPNNLVTREQMSKFLVNGFELNMLY